MCIPQCGNCADFDLCGNCEASPFLRHDPKHIFLKIRRPVQSRMGPAAPLLPMMYERGWGRSAECKPRVTSTRCTKFSTVDPKKDASESDHDDAVVPTVLTVAPVPLEVPTVPAEPSVSSFFSSSSSTIEAPVAAELPVAAEPITPSEPTVAPTRSAQELNAKRTVGDIYLQASYHRPHSLTFCRLLLLSFNINSAFVAKLRANPSLN